MMMLAGKIGSLTRAIALGAWERASMRLGIFLFGSKRGLNIPLCMPPWLQPRLGRVKDQTWMLVPTYHVVPVMIS